MKIIASAPCRISLFGGGTDLPVFYEKHGGLVISMAINLKQHIEFDTDAPKGISPEWAIPQNGNVDFYGKFMDEFKLNRVFFVNKSDAPIQSGLGSSASAAVALVAALSRIKGQNLTKEEIAEKAWDIEVNKLGLYGGKQDQYRAVYGGFGSTRFKDYAISTVYNAFVNNDFWEERLMLFYTGETRKDPKIQERFKQLTLV